MRKDLNSECHLHEKGLELEEPLQDPEITYNGNAYSFFFLGNSSTFKC